MTGRRMLGVAAKSVGAALLAVVIVLAAALVFLQTRWGGALVRRYVVAQVNGLIAGRVEIERLGFDWTRIELREVVLRDPGGERVARLTRVHLDLAIRPLLRRTVRFQAVEVHGSELLITRDDGQTNLERALALRVPPPRAEPRWAVRVDHLAIRDGAVSYVASPGAPGLPRVVVDRLEAFGAARFEPDPRAFSGWLALEALSRTVPRGTLTLEVQGEGGQRLESARGRLTWGDAVDVRFVVPRAEHLSVVLDRLEVAPELGAALAPRWPVRVPLVARGDVEVRAALVSARGTVEAAGGGGDLAFSGSVARDERSSPDGIRVVARGVDLERLLAVQTSGEASLEVVVRPGSLRPEEIEGRLDLVVPPMVLRGVRVGGARAAVRVESGRLEQARLRAELPGATVRLDGAGPIGATVVRGRVAVSSLAVAARAVRRLGRAVPVPVSGRGTVRLQVDRLLLGPDRLGLSVGARFPVLRIGDTALRRLIVEAALPAPAPADSPGRRPFRLRASLAGPHPVSVAARGARIPDEAVGGLRLRVDALELAHPRGRWRSPAPAHVAFGPGRLAIEDLVLRSGPQRLRLDLRRIGNAVDGTLAFSALALATLPVPPGSPLAGASGRLSGRVGVTGTMPSPVLRLQARLADGRVRGFRDLGAALEATYRDGRLDGEAQVRAPALGAHARFDLPAAWPLPAHAPVHVQLHVHRLAFDQELGGGRVRARVDGGAAALRLGGTAGHPRLALTLGAPEIALVRGEPDGGTISFVGAVSAELRYRDGVVALSLATRSDEHGTLAAQGRLGVALSLAGGDRDVRIRRGPVAGELHLEGFDVSWVAELLEPLRKARGRVTGTLRIGGTIERPSVEGGVTWQDGRVVIGG